MKPHGPPPELPLDAWEVIDLARRLAIGVEQLGRARDHSHRAALRALLQEANMLVPAVRRFNAAELQREVARSTAARERDFPTARRRRPDHAPCSVPTRRVWPPSEGPR